VVTFDSEFAIKSRSDHIAKRVAVLVNVSVRLERDRIFNNHFTAVLLLT